jgi:hypothetical protein
LIISKELCISKHLTQKLCFVKFFITHEKFSVARFMLVAGSSNALREKRIAPPPPPLIRPTSPLPHICNMTKNDRYFGTDKRTAEQIAAGIAIKKRVQEREEETAKLVARIGKVADEIIKEYVRRARINPHPICPNCGTVYDGPVLLQLGTSVAASDVAVERLMQIRPGRTGTNGYPDGDAEPSSAHPKPDCRGEGEAP